MNEFTDVFPTVQANPGLIDGKSFASTRQIHQPTGCSLFVKELAAPPREWVEQSYTDVVYWNELEKGGHFAAFEQPGLFVQ